MSAIDTIAHGAYLKKRLASANNEGWGDGMTMWKEPWTLRSSSIGITSQLFYVGNKNVSSHLLKTAKGAVLFDSCFAQSAYLLTENIRAAGVNPADIKYIFHSHGHVDHCGATRRIAEWSGAKT